MSITIELAPEEEARLVAAAAEQGLPPSEFARRLISNNLPPARPGAATLALLAAWDEEDRTDDPTELKARRDEWEEFKQAINADHTSDRLIYP